MENQFFDAFGPDNQGTTFENSYSHFPGEADSESVSAGEFNGHSGFADTDFERMTDSEYFNYLRSQDDML